MIKIEPRMVIKKTIYAKRKAVSSKDMQDIFNMEIEHHLRMHPDLRYMSLSKPVENQDRSKTFTIMFDKKPVE